MKKLLGLMAMVMILGGGIANAGELVATWLASDRAEGYFVYLGSATGTYDVGKFDAGNALEFRKPFEQLNDDSMIFVAVSAYNSYGESDLSDDVFVVIPGLKLLPDRPTGVKVITITVQ